MTELVDGEQDEKCVDGRIELRLRPLTGMDGELIDERRRGDESECYQHGAARLISKLAGRWDHRSSISARSSPFLRGPRQLAYQTLGNEGKPAYQA